MRKTTLFILSVITAITFGLLNAGCGCTAPIELDLSAELTAATTTLFDTFYNKDPDTTFLTADITSDFYLDITDAISDDLTSISINGIVFEDDEDISYSVGNNNFVETPAFMVIDETLSIAIPTLSVEAEDGVTDIMVGAQRYNITLFASPSALEISEADIFFGDGTVTVNSTGAKPIVTYARTEGTAMAGWTFTKNDVVLTGGQKAFVKKDYSDATATAYAIDVIEDAEVQGYSEGYYNYWLDGAIVTPRNRTVDFTTAIPGTGIINFNVVVTETVPA